MPVDRCGGPRCGTGTVAYSKTRRWTDFSSSARRRSVHEVGLSDLLDMARLLGLRAASACARVHSARQHRLERGAVAAGAHGLFDAATRAQRPAHALGSIMSRLAEIPIRVEPPAAPVASERSSMVWEAVSPQFSSEISNTARAARR